MRNDLPLTVIGNLVDDPELGFTSAGVPFARFTVASTPRSYGRDTNTWQDGEATFLDCSAWRQFAENLAESNVTKGTRVVVAGRLRTDRWETPEGEKRSRMVMDVDDVGASMTFTTVTIAAPHAAYHPEKQHPTTLGPPPAAHAPPHPLPPKPPTPTPLRAPPF